MAQCGGCLNQTNLVVNADIDEVSAMVSIGTLQSFDIKYSGN
jgi:hypothetical protein